MSQGRLVICESTGRWAAALRKTWPRYGYPLRETRSLDECREALRAVPASFASLEVKPDQLERIVPWLIDAQRMLPQVSLALLLPSGVPELEELFQELGTVQQFTTLRQMPALAAAALRHLTHGAEPPQSLVEQLWEELPWAEA